MSFESNTHQRLTTFKCPGAPEEKKLPGGFLAIPCWIIIKDTHIWNQGEKAQAKLLNAYWKPKGRDDLGSQLQRTVTTTVDNVTFLFKKGMKEPHILLGEFKKDADLYGSKTQLHGLVLGGGGHYERIGNKPPGVEGGDMSLMDAANKEILEEMKIPPEKVLLTYFLGFIDYYANDPRAHTNRAVYLRHVEIDPKASEELKTVISVPLSLIGKLCDGEIGWVHGGKKLQLVLNHDEMIRSVMHHPDTGAFLTKVVTSYDTPSSANVYRSL